MQAASHILQVTTSDAEGGDGPLLSVVPGLADRLPSVRPDTLRTTRPHPARPAGDPKRDPKSLFWSSSKSAAARKRHAPDRHQVTKSRRNHLTNQDKIAYFGWGEDLVHQHHRG